MSSNTIADDLARLGSDMGRDYFGAVRKPSEFEFGHRLMIDAILGGGDPAAVLALARAADLTINDGEPDRSRGAMAGLLDCLDSLQAGGKTLQIEDASLWPGLAVAALAAGPTMRRAMLCVMYRESYAATLALLFAAARAAGPYLKRAEPAAPPALPAPTPVHVNVELALPAGPVPVAIVGQPATRSVQTVRRDEDAEIVETVTETRPLPAAA